MTRQYIPKVGDKVKLRLWEHYSQLDEERARSQARLPDAWSWFDVLEVSPEICRLRHTSRALNAPDPAWEGDVPTEQVAAPLGWKPVYEIVCKDKEQADKVVSEWFKRGIHVWTNHNMSSSQCGGKAFTPAENGSGGSPHWQYTGNPTETIPAELCPMLFTVKWLEEWEPKLPPTEEKAARRREIEKLKRDTTLEFEFVRFGPEKIPYCRREHLVYEPGQQTIKGA